MSIFQQPKASVRVREAGGAACILEIKGELTAFAEETLMAAYTEGCGNGVRAIVINFQDLEYMSSSGIGLLVTLLIRAQRREQRLLAYGLSEHYRGILELTRLNEAFSVCATESEALIEAGALA